MMSRNVAEKLANDEQLDEDDVQYARDHGIALPEEYGVDPGMSQVEPGTTPVPVVSGPAYPMAQRQQQPSEPGLFLNTDQLEMLTVSELTTLADAADVEVSGKKADIIAQLSGGTASAGEEEEEQPAEEETS